MNLIVICILQVTPPSCTQHNRITLATEINDSRTLESIDILNKYLQGSILMSCYIKIGVEK